MVLKNISDIKKPVKDFALNKNRNDLNVQIIDYSRCLDTLDMDDQDPDIDNDNGHNHDNDNDNDNDNDDPQLLYSKEKQKELSYTRPMLIKAYGILESGHSITINLQNFQPFFYIKIPDNWERNQCQNLLDGLKKEIYYKYRNNLIKTQIVVRKPFKEFTANDKFKYLKLICKNKETYDQFVRKFEKPIKINGLNQNLPYKYDLYESNIEPIIKFVHMTKIKPTGWIQLPQFKYKIQRERTSHTHFEVNIEWNQIKPLDRIDNASINTASYDIESNSSHGDFPQAIKNYQKLSQDLITIFNEHGINTKRHQAHRLFKKDPKKVITSLLHLVFDDNYNNNGIHQIQTLNNLKPHPETVSQLSHAIYQSFQECLELNISNDEFYEQTHDLFEFNLPLINNSIDDNSHYDLLSREIIKQLLIFNKNNNKRFKEAPVEVIGSMINLAFNDHYDAFNIGCIYTKLNIKPDQIVIEALVPDVFKILQDCANFVHHKKLPEPSTFTVSDGTIYKPENMCQDAFVKQLTDLFDQYLPKIEGDQLIQIGTTFQIVGQSDCYLKHMLCLGSCDQISNDDLISAENKDIYLPSEDLAKDLVKYDQHLGLLPSLSKEEFANLVKKKEAEIKGWDIKYRKEQCKKAAEYRRIKQKQTDKAQVIVEYFDNEKDLLLAWKQLIITNDPDVLIGYNIFGFDFNFLYGRSVELGCENEFCQLGRLKGFYEPLYVRETESKGMGGNCLKYIPMTGRVIADVYKLMQRDYRLGSYKLDSVCHKFLYKEKVDVSPQMIFSLQKGSSADRKIIAEYCLIDCVLCHRLFFKLEILGNNIAMSNVCKVPLPYLFLRGQGVKIFSLVADVCDRKGYLVPVLAKFDPLSDNDGYEGAIVLKPFTGIYFDPIAVADFNSLYPSSMISENLSHDSLVTPGSPYDNLPQYTYVDITYDIYKQVPLPGKKKKIKQKVGEQTSRYAQLPNGEKSILPSILIDLLAARKDAKYKMDNEEDPFKAKIWNGLQMAYKTTANSLYGQCGAKTSPIYKKEIAASTTAIGRNMIIFSKKHVEKEYKDRIITLGLNVTCVYDDADVKKLNPIPTPYTGRVVHSKDSYCVYGDTDSIFIKFNCYTPEGEKITGNDAIFISMALCKMAAKEISMQLKKPQNLDFEKVIYPFILLSKKRYHGHYYTKFNNLKYYPNSMGIVLKRRDNAEIVKHVYGGALDIIMKEHNIEKSLEFVKNECQKLLNGGFPLDMFIISKTLKSYYKKPNQISHNVLANRQAQRDPGNRFEPNDRVPYAFIVNPNPSKTTLQGEKIETPEYIRQNNLKIDYKSYLINQITNPVSQIFDLVMGNEKTENMFNSMINEYERKLSGGTKFDDFFTGKNKRPPITKLFDLIEQRRIAKELDKQSVVSVDSIEEGDNEDESLENEDIDEEKNNNNDEDDNGLTNYDDPNF